VRRLNKEYIVFLIAVIIGAIVAITVISYGLANQLILWIGSIAVLIGCAMGFLILSERINREVRVVTSITISTITATVLLILGYAGTTSGIKGVEGLMFSGALVGGILGMMMIIIWAKCSLLSKKPEPA